MISLLDAFLIRLPILAKIDIGDSGQVRRHPFSIVFDLFFTSNSDVAKLIGLTGLLALVTIVFQGIQIFFNSGNQKIVEQKKSNIKKILIAFAIIISIEGLIRGLNVLWINAKGSDFVS